MHIINFCFIQRPLCIISLAYLQEARVVIYRHTGHLGSASSKMYWNFFPKKEVLHFPFQTFPSFPYTASTPTHGVLSPQPGLAVRTYCTQMHGGLGHTISFPQSDDIYLGLLSTLNINIMNERYIHHLST